MKKVSLSLMLVMVALGSLMVAFNIHTAKACPPRPKLIGDINGDGKVDINDVAIAARALGSTPGHPRWNSKADINQNNIIDMIDICIISSHFGDNCDS